MELAFLLMILFLLIVVTMLPIIIFFGLFGMVFKSFVAILLFALKYLLPAGIIGLIIAKIRDKKGDFIWQEYLAHIGGAVGVGLVLLLIWLNIPVVPELPKTDAVKLISVSYEIGGETRTSSTETEWVIENMASSLNSPEYKRTLKEFIEEDEDDPEYTVTLTDTEGKEYTVIFYNYKVLGVQKNGKISYYMLKDEEATVPQDLADNVFTLEKKAESEAIWKPFVEELFSSVEYNEEEQAITFVIPENIPGDDYEIDIYIEGALGYTGGEFVPREFLIYEDEQKQDLWVEGQKYSLPFEDICFSRFNIKVDIPYLVDPYMYDVFPLLPEDKVYKK